MTTNSDIHIPVGTRALILSKLYYGVLSKSLESLDIERYYSILFFLNKNNGCTQQHICNNLAVDKTAMVKVIETLMLSKHVIKKVNPLDRRENFVFLTKKGLNHAEKISASFELIDQEIFSTVSEHNFKIFNTVLSELTFNLKKLPANDLFFNYKKTKSIKNNELTQTLK